MVPYQLHSKTASKKQNQEIKFATLKRGPRWHYDTMIFFEFNSLTDNANKSLYILQMGSLIQLLFSFLRYHFYSIHFRYQRQIFKFYGKYCMVLLLNFFHLGPNNRIDLTLQCSTFYLTKCLCQLVHTVKP